MVGTDPTRIPHPYNARYGTSSIPKFHIPSKGMNADAAYELIHSELALDGSPVLKSVNKSFTCLNTDQAHSLASFINTWMPDPSTKLVTENLSKNLVDQDEYPMTSKCAQCVLFPVRKPVCRCYSHTLRFHSRQSLACSIRRPSYRNGDDRFFRGHRARGSCDEASLAGTSQDCWEINSRARAQYCHGCQCPSCTREVRSLLRSRVSTCPGHRRKQV